jgi:hypothetical protein
MGCHLNSWCKTGEPLMQFKGRTLITPVFLHCCHKGY